MIDVFSRYLFAYPTQNATAKTIGRCFVDVMTRHAYLPTLSLSDKGSQFRSEVVAEITNQSCIYQTRPNNRNIGENSRLNQNGAENIDGRTTIHVAQICPNCGDELQYNLP